MVCCVGMVSDGYGELSGGVGEVCDGVVGVVADEMVKKYVRV